MMICQGPFSASRGRSLELPSLKKKVRISEKVYVEQNQKNGLNALSIEQVNRIMQGATSDVEEMSPNQPWSSVLGY